MDPTPSRPATDALPAGRLPLSRQVLAASEPREVTATLAWADAPALPAALAGAVRETWSLDIRTDGGGRSLTEFPALAALLAHARAEQIVRALSHRTNLVLPGARAAVVGAGPVAAALARMLRHGGARVLRAATDPLVRLRAHLEGVEVIGDDPASWPIVDYVLATGEAAPPLDPAALTGVALDASFDGSGLRAVTGERVRPHVAQVAERTWVVAAPPAVTVPAAATDAQWQLADALIAASALVIADAGTADARLAELVLA